MVLDLDIVAALTIFVAACTAVLVDRHSARGAAVEPAIDVAIFKVVAASITGLIDVALKLASDLESVVFDQALFWILHRHGQGNSHI